MLSVTSVFADGWPTGNNSSANNTDTISGPALSGTEEKQANIPEEKEQIVDISRTINYNTTADSEGDKMASDIYAQYSDVIPDVSIDDAIAWSNKKGFEIIKFLQTFIQPFAIICFMLGAIFVLVGSIGNNQLAGKGMWGMVCSVLAYAGVIYAPLILQVLVGWLGS